MFDKWFRRVGTTLCGSLDNEYPLKLHFRPPERMSRLKLGGSEPRKIALGGLFSYPAVNYDTRHLVLRTGIEAQFLPRALDTVTTGIPVRYSSRSKMCLDVGISQLKKLLKSAISITPLISGFWVKTSGGGLTFSQHCKRWAQFFDTLDLSNRYLQFY